MNIYFDMDGTIADFYGVTDWEKDLSIYSTRPYEVAKPIGRFCYFARLLNLVQKKGHTINIISWSSKTTTPTYDRDVEIAKRVWLARHLPSVKFDKIEVVAYGTPKHEGRTGILFDDNESIRTDWDKSGNTSYTEKEIISVLRGLLKE